MILMLCRVNTQRSQPQSHAIEFQPAQPYAPPKGFNPVSLNNRTMSKAERIFENLHHKQIWHITAPAGISLKNLSQLVMDKALDGQPVLTHKGTEYGFSQKERSEDLEREVLVPGTAGYKAGKIHKTFSGDVSLTYLTSANTHIPDSTFTGDGTITGIK